MDHRRLGRSSLRVSTIGFGAFKIGRNTGTKYPTGYELPTDEAVVDLVRRWRNADVTFADTAPAYGTSESRLAAALHATDAPALPPVLVSTKVGEAYGNGSSTYCYDEDFVRRSIRASHVALNRDVLDLVWVHSNGDDLAILESTDVVRVLRGERDSGRIRAIGFSGKTVDGARAALGWADALMVTYHMNDVSHADVMGEAHANGVGVIVKKALASGHLSPDEAIPFALDHPAVDSLVIGGLHPERFVRNVEIAQAARPPRV